MCYVIIFLPHCTAPRPEASTRRCLNNVVIAYQLDFPDRGNILLRESR